MVVVMTREIKSELIEKAIAQFQTEGNVKSYGRYGNGHINDTFAVVFKEDVKEKRYILQRINHSIFKDPEKLMFNITQVTSFLKEEVKKLGGDEFREVVTVISTRNGNSFYSDSEGSFWRMYLFIEDASCFEQVDKPEDFYQSAVAFGRFQKLLSAFDASGLYEVIPDFHNTPLRYERFLQVVKEDKCNRAKEVKDEIEFFIKRKEDMECCKNYLDEGKLPLRVTHNDTKLNNVMIDNKTGKGLCVIDLDTVMPGLSLFDFGDSIRFGANTAAEDEKDLSKVSLDLDLFEQYVKGYLTGCEGSLTDTEISMLPHGAKTMTLECGMRFLTDYLEGDVYFRIHREEHNLDRCHTQMALVLDMEQKWNEMNEIVAKYR
ncbi:Phosphotransferase enzyme family protein [Anaerocolumna xylanovorans DSM 12503]|uniref:Phosphotransferase enzyme family protein n=2 Tax=Anaerocolumna TaxID=1843210 RepID=A0A1M7Y7N9_9FIRM|nr:aminoglycoside phosphotransferase family protein [Anaerocolumna xylanovorans]SHO48644.1 Phosphotransferase enzyme family protein [Anaerocolumna xylanovorans DSM 12503]